jgi:hypothetical protein
LNCDDAFEKQLTLAGRGLFKLEKDYFSERIAHGEIEKDNASFLSVEYFRSFH